MKHGGVWWIACGVAVLYLMGPAWAKEKAVHQDKAAPVLAAKGQTPAPTPPPAAPKADHVAQQAQAAARLKGTAWAIELTPMTGEKPKRPLTDTLHFENGKIGSDGLTKSGYPATNYTLTIGDDNTPVWESMQTKEGEGVSFWRGELRGETMRGILSKHPIEGNAEDYSFVGHQSGSAAPATADATPSTATDSETMPATEPAATMASPPASPDSAAIEPPAQPVAQPAQSPAPKKQRKGWF